MTKENVLVRTAADLERKYDFSGIQKAAKQSSTGLTKVETTLNKFVGEVTSDIENLENQVDKKIVTWFYDGVPTLDNNPASNWETIEVRNEHTGDIYYNRQTGHVYSFTYDIEEESFKWLELTNKDLVEAMSVANSDIDTTDHKRTIFAMKPDTPYEVGDIWFKEGKVLYRCIVSRTSEDEYHELDWVIYTDYSTETAGKKSTAQLSAYKTIVNTTYIDDATLTIDTDSITAKVQKIERIATGENNVFEDTPTTPYFTGDVWLKNAGTSEEQIWVSQMDRASDEEFVESDFTYQPNYKSTALLKVESDNISTEVSKKVGENEIISKINQSAEELSIDASKINLNGATSINDRFKIGTDGKMDAESPFNGLYNFDYYDLNSVYQVYRNKINADSYLKNIYDVNNNGNIDIGDVSKMYQILIGNIQNTKTAEGKLKIYSNNPKHCVVIEDTNGNVICSMGSGGLNSKFVYSGNALIGEIPTSYNEFNGIMLNGSTGLVDCATLNQRSLEEKKKNFEKLDNGLNIIQNIDIYKYNLKTEDDNTKKHIGLVIGDKYKYSQDITSNNNDSVDVYSFVSVCCKAIQEQQKQIEELKQEISKLKGENL